MGMAGGCCAESTEASSEVTQVQDLAWAAIIFHVLALAAAGFLNWAQWAAAAVVIPCSLGVLCRFRKGAYTAAVVGYAIGGFFDLVAVAFWIIFYFAVKEPLDDVWDNFFEQNYNSTIVVEDEHDFEDWTEVIGWPALDAIVDWLEVTSDVVLWFAIFPALAALVVLEGYRSAFVAIKKWQDSGAPDARQEVQDLSPTPITTTKEVFQTTANFVKEKEKEKEEVEQKSSAYTDAVEEGQQARGGQDLDQNDVGQ
ncbi:unnamed protein product [Ascophyllum nodosum]